MRADLSRVDLRAGRPRHRQDRGRPAPRGVPALRAPRAAAPPGRAGGRAERQLPALHPRRAAGPRRDRREADHDRGAGRPRRPAIEATEPADVATLKGDARLAIVLHRALWSHLVPPAEALVVPRGARRWRVAAYEAESIVAELRTRGVRYGAARGMLPQALAHRMLVKMELAGDSPDDRVQNAVARSAPVKELRERALAGGRAAQARLAAARRAPTSSPPRPTASSSGASRRCCSGRSRPARPAPPVVAGGRRPDRRGHRPGGAHRLGGAHRRRRGPGPVRDDAARARPPLLDGLA